MKKRPWLKWIAIFLCFVMFVLMVFIFRKVKKTNALERAMLREISMEYENTMRPLLDKKAQLEEKIAKQEEAVLDEAPPPPVMLLCTEPSLSLLTDICPITDRYYYPMAIVVFEDAFPGEPGWMSKEDVIALCNRGWEICLGADADTDLAALFQRVKKAGLPEPAAVYYPDNDTTPEQDAETLSLGIQTVIFYGKKLMTDETEGIWYLSAYGSNEDDSKSEFQTKTRNSTPQVLTVGYRNEHDQFSESNYGNMLKTVYNYELANDVAVMSIRKAREACLDDQNDAFSKPESEAERRLEELKAELDEVNELIRSFQK